MIHGLHRSCLERGATNILGLLSRTDRKAFKVVGTSMECDFRLPRFTSEAILGLTSNAIELNYIELWANSKKRPLTTKEYKRLTFTTLLRLTISSIFRLTPGDYPTIGQDRSKCKVSALKFANISEQMLNSLALSTNSLTFWTVRPE